MTPKPGLDPSPRSTSRVNPMTTLWGIHNDTHLDLLGGGFISIGWDDMGDLRLVGNDRESMKRRLAEVLPEAKPGAIPVWAGVLIRFAHDMQVGDFVVAPQRSDSTVNLGRITGDYYFEPNALHGSRRPVAWLKSGIPRAQFSQAARYEIGSAVTLFRVKKHASEFLAVLDGTTSDAITPRTEETLTIDEATENAESLPNADRIDQYTRDFVIDRLYTQLHGYQFEHFVAHLLSCMGYRTQVTQASGDGGIDVIAHKDPLPSSRRSSRFRPRRSSQAWGHLTFSA